MTGIGATSGQPKKRNTEERVTEQCTNEIDDGEKVVLFGGIVICSIWYNLCDNQCNLCTILLYKPYKSERYFESYPCSARLVNKFIGWFLTRIQIGKHIGTYVKVHTYIGTYWSTYI